jgi:putative ABC transport system permease protein
MIADIGRDLRFGARMLRKSPGFTLIAVMTLALGIGANTAIFQLLNSVLLRSLPVSKPQELVEVRPVDMTGARGSFNLSRPSVTNPIWEKVREDQQAFSGIFAWSTAGFNIARGGEARWVAGLWVSGEFFDVLGVRPMMGRVFTPADDQPDRASPCAVISHSFWQREFGGDASVIGKTITLDHKAVEIIGVTPPSFFGLEVGLFYDVAVPLCWQADLRGENSNLKSSTTWWLTVMGRLKPEYTIEQATAHLNALSPGIFEATLGPDYPTASVKEYLGFKLGAYPAGTGMSWLRARYSDPLWLLLAIAGLVLLIACANLANLMLARASARQQEIAVRLALGASRSRLIHQLLVESLLLATTGAVLGVFLAYGLSQFLVSLMSVKLDVALDWRVLAFTAGVAVSTCVLFGLTPALRVTRIAPGLVMRAGSRNLTTSRERFSLRRALVVLQVTLSVVLVVGALLFTRSLRNLVTLDAGFKQEGILVTNLDMTRLKLPLERRNDYQREVLGRLRAQPGVESAAEADIVPISGSAWNNKVRIEGANSDQEKVSFFNTVSDGFFKTLESPLLSGRDFDDRDTSASPRVAIVNEAFARLLLNGSNPVGQRFRREATPRDPETVFEIVGFVKDTKYQDLREDFLPVAYISKSQDPRPGQYDDILIKSNAPLADLTSQVKRTLEQVSPDISINFQVLKTIIKESLLREELMAMLSGFFGLLALLLACVGLYGIMSFAVASRTREIGIRMALGAERRDVVWLILREALLLVLVGVAVGLPSALAAARLVSSLLFGLTPADPVSMSLAALLMLAVGAAASYIPARRALRVDPMVALRYE